jgi:hypothetical protein
VENELHENFLFSFEVGILRRRRIKNSMEVVLFAAVRVNSNILL